jgi:hypothetical protein
VVTRSPATKMQFSAKPGYRGSSSTDRICVRAEANGCGELCTGSVYRICEQDL